MRTHSSRASLGSNGSSLAGHDAKPDFAEVATDGDHAACARAVREQDSGVARSVWLLPLQQRRALMAICAWCWRADNLLDTGPQDDLAWLDRQHEALVTELDDIYSDRPMATAEARALSDAIHRYRIPKKHLDQFLAGIGMDRRIRRYETFEQLLIYCRAVLSPVTVLATEVLGYRSAHTPEYASLAGVAMQLSNICRDVGEDLTRGRVYLPADELAHFGVDEDDLEQGQVTERFTALMRFQIARARWCYAEAEPSVSDIRSVRGRCAALALGRLYALKLTAVEKASYQCLRAKPRTSNGQRLATLVRALVDVGRMRNFPALSPAPDPRTFRDDSSQKLGNGALLA